MSTLRHLPSGTTHVLTARHVVGRASNCQLRIASPEVSGLHAELRWEGDRWFVQDLGSRNGTFLDGQRLAAGERAALKVGVELSFGGKEERFEVADLDPPRLMARTADGRAVMADDNILSLPSQENPLITVFEDAQARWMIDEAEGSRLLGEDEVVVVEGTAYTIMLPTASDRTRDVDSGQLPLEGVTLGFVVSRDQEYVSVRMTHERGVIELEPRAHAQLLLTLSRMRLADRERPHLPESEHGWVHRDDLLHALGVDLQLLNLWVYRARRQLAKTGIRDAGNIIERRSGTLQLRIGVSSISVDESPPPGGSAQDAPTK